MLMKSPDERTGDEQIVHDRAMILLDQSLAHKGQAQGYIRWNGTTQSGMNVTAGNRETHFVPAETMGFIHALEYMRIHGLAVPVDETAVLVTPKGCRLAWAGQALPDFSEF